MKFSSLFKIFPQPLTLKGKLVAVSIIVLFLLNCFSLIFVNLAATFFVTRYINFSFLGEPFPENFYTSSSTSAGEGSFPTPSAVIQFVTPSEIIEARRLAQSTLQNLRLFSIGLLLFTTFLGGLGIYFLSRRTLRPLEEVSQAAKEISAKSLERRLSFRESSDEVKVLADAFNTMLERLEKSFRDQERFSSSVAHELRTPLATMRTNLEVVLQDKQATKEEYREMGKAIEKALSRLEEIVENLLLLSKGEKELERSWVFLAPLLEEVRHELLSLAREKDVRVLVEVERDMQCFADEALLSRALKNVIENGIRYNRPGGYVKVTYLQEKEWVVIEVEDNGIGIPVDEQDSIFEVFSRGAQARKLHKEGAGLGLAITHLIVQLHGGKIEVQSSPDGGTTFRILLPSI